MYSWHQSDLFGKGEFPFKLFYVERLQFPPHWHEAVEIIYGVTGVLKVGINNTIYMLKPNDILIIGAAEVHCFVPQEEYSEVIIVQFNQEICDFYKENKKEATRLLLSKSMMFESDKNSEVHREMDIQIRKIIDEFNNKLELYQLALKARLFDLFVIIQRKALNESYTMQERDSHHTKLKSLEKVFQFVESYYMNNISLKDVADLMNYSEYYFCRFFKQTTGTTFKLFLNIYRIRKAEWFLIETHETITEIAFKSGFNSIKTFNRVFRQLKGFSPTHYRKET